VHGVCEARKVISQPSWLRLPRIARARAYHRSPSLWRRGRLRFSLRERSRTTRARQTWHSNWPPRPRPRLGRRLRTAIVYVPRAACESWRRSSARTTRPRSVSTAGRRPTASGASSYTVSGGRAGERRRRRLGKNSRSRWAGAGPAYPGYGRLLWQPRAPLIDLCITNRHCGHKKAGSSEAVIKDRRSAVRFRAFWVIRHSAAMSSSRLSGRPLASVALKWVQTNSSGFRSGA